MSEENYDVLYTSWRTKYWTGLYYSGFNKTVATLACIIFDWSRGHEAIKRQIVV
jgi:hypothetical protein